MLLTYVDESYCADCYYIAALICQERQALPLSAALDRVVGNASAVYGIPPNTELHGYEIFQGRAGWTAMNTLTRARIDVYGQVFDEIAAHGARIIIRGVRCPALVARYGENVRHPHSVVLTHLLERVDEHVEKAGELTLVVADEPGRSDLQPQYRRDLARFRRSGTRGYRSRKLTRIVDTLHFTPSYASRLLQAIDLVAFLYHRIETTKPSADRRAVRANEALWGRIEPCVVHNHCWRP